MCRNKCSDAQKEVTRIAKLRLLPERLLCTPKGRVASARNRGHEHLVRGVFARMNPPHVGLNEQRVAMRSLPNIREARLNLNACHETKVGMRADGGRERAAAGKYLQRLPGRVSVPLSPNSERAHRRRYLNEPDGRRDFHLVPFNQRREQFPIYDVDT